MTRVLVLGGGFGGLAAANELRSVLPEDATVTVVDRRDHFFMGFAKLWDLAGMRPLADGTRSLRSLPGRGIEFVQADVHAIDPTGPAVETSAGRLEADGLVIALGSGPKPEHRAMVAGPGAHDLYDPAALPAIRADLGRITSGRVLVAVLGGPHKCPPAPFESALIVDALLRERGVRDDVEVAVSTPKPITLPVAGVDASKYVADHLGDHDVRILPGHAVAGVDGATREVTFANGESVGYDVLLGVPADAPSPLLADAGLAGPSGWIEPDRHTLATSSPRVYAIGDCTMIPTAAGQLPRAGVFAAGEGVVAARNLAAELGVGQPDRFEGHGYCFLELPGEKVAFVEGDFYADPQDVTLTEADHDQFRRKQAFEAERLDLWLGPVD